MIDLDRARDKELRERAASLYDAAHRVASPVVRRRLLAGALAALIEAERLAGDEIAAA